MRTSVNLADSLLCSEIASRVCMPCPKAPLRLPFADVDQHGLPLRGFTALFHFNGYDYDELRHT